MDIQYVYILKVWSTQQVKKQSKQRKSPERNHKNLRYPVLATSQLPNSRKGSLTLKKQGWGCIPYNNAQQEVLPFPMQAGSLIGSLVGLASQQVRSER